MKEFDLGEWKAYEQAKNLSVDLVSTWLRDFNLKESAGKDKSSAIAKKLVDNSVWKTHGRPLTIDIVKKLGVNVLDYNDPESEISKKGAAKMVSELSDCFAEYLEIMNYSYGVLTRQDDTYGE